MLKENLGIQEIENLTYDEAAEMALEKLDIKGHGCFLVDFGGYFGYSILVFHSGKHIHYANDYELHHHHLVKESGREALRAYYINEMERKLFTDEELLGPIGSYDEYRRKNDFLRNYWIMRYDYKTSFFIGTDKEREAYYNDMIKQFPYYNPVSFCYVADKNIITQEQEYMKHIQEEYEKLQENDNAFREMVSRELANHEACITCDYTEALSSLGITFDSLSTDRQKIVKEELRKQIESYC